MNCKNISSVLFNHVLLSQIQTLVVYNSITDLGQVINIDEIYGDVDEPTVPWRSLIKLKCASNKLEEIGECMVFGMMLAYIRLY